MQNSVFEGEATEAQVEAIKAGLRRLIIPHSDSVLIYTARDQRWLAKDVIGRERGQTDNLL